MSDTCTCCCCDGQGYVPKAVVGKPAPDFTMATTADIEKLTSKASLADYKGKWLILFFYPLDFTFVCPTEITALSDRYEEFEELGADILGVSTDSVHSHKAWLKLPRSEQGVQGTVYPLASDITKQVSKDYGVYIPEEGIATRGLFIIDPNGILQYAVYHNLNIGRSVDETLRVLEGLQSGGLCAANWHPGDSNL